MRASLLVILCTFICLAACKKGENDPSFSLRTRKARACDEWNLKEGYLTAKVVDINNQSSSITYSLSGTEYSVGIIGKGTAVGAFEIELNMQNDNSFVCKQLIDQDLEITRGDWQFMKKQGEFKNKERILFKTDNKYPTSNNLLSFSKASFSFVYAAEQLSKDTMVLVCNNELLYANVTGNVSDKVYLSARYVLIAD